MNKQTQIPDKILLGADYLSVCPLAFLRFKGTHIDTN